MSKDLLSMIAEEGVEYVDIRFTDPRGKLQHVTVCADQVDEDFIADGFISNIASRSSNICLTLAGAKPGQAILMISCAMLWGVGFATIPKPKNTSTLESCFQTFQSENHFDFGIACSNIFVERIDTAPGPARSIQPSRPLDPSELKDPGSTMID